MAKNQNGQKSYSTPSGGLQVFPPQENIRGTRNASLAGDRYNGHSRKALSSPIRGKNRQVIN